MLRIYKNFDREGDLSAFRNLRWIRSYNGLRRFELNVNYDQELFEMLTDGTGLVNKQAFEVGNLETIIYKESVAEACIVRDINVYEDSKTPRTIKVTGVGTEGILDRRMTTIIGSYTAQEAVSKLLNENFINPSDPSRKIAELEVGNLTVSNTEKQLLDYQSKTSVLSILSDLLEPLNIGFRVKFDFTARKYLFELYEGKYNPFVVYSKNFNNIINEDWFFLSRDYANVVYVGDTVVGSMAGLKRRERAIPVIKDEAPSVTGGRFLAEKQIVRSVDCEIDSLSDQFIYLTDWDIGDIITFESEVLKTKIQRNIPEIQEYTENGFTKIDVVFGDYIRR